MAKPTYKQKVNLKPRFSVNKFGEYLVSTSSSRRKRIIHDQKFPPTFIVIAYKDAREAIVKYIINDYDQSILTDAIKKITDSVVLEQAEKDNSILALKEITKCNLPDLSSYKKTKYKEENSKLKISGLDISVNPDVIIRKGNKVGCIKVHVIKTEQNRLPKAGSEFVSAILQLYTEGHLLKDGEIVDGKICISIDCFGNSYEVAPKSVKRRLENIQDACEEIVNRWDSVEK